MFAKIDVIIPCYNAERTLSRAVQSVIGQVCLGKLWLIDDASTDNTLALAKQWAARYPEQIFVEAMPRNGGVAKARNWGCLAIRQRIHRVFRCGRRLRNGRVGNGGSHLLFPTRYRIGSPCFKADRFAGVLCRTAKF